MTHNILKETVRNEKAHLEVESFDELSKYLKSTYECSHYFLGDYFGWGEELYIVFYSNSGHMFSVQDTADEGYTKSGISRPKPKSNNATVAEFELLTGKPWQSNRMDAHNNSAMNPHITKKYKFDNYIDTGVYSYREFCENCNSCIKTALKCPICGSTS